MIKQATAYDYDTQQWVTGEEGGRLRLKQLNDELTLLNDPIAGAKYARFAMRCTRQEAIKLCEAAIADLQIAPRGWESIEGSTR